MRGCPKPYGNEHKGFTRQGLTNHNNKLHNPDSTTARRAAARVGVAETVTEMPGVSPGYDTDGNGNEVVDYGTPGDEVVMGGHTTFMDDVKTLVDPNARIYQGLKPEAPVVPSDDGEPVVHLKARGGQLFVNMGDGWETMDLDRFCSNIRFAVRIS